MSGRGFLRALALPLAAAACTFEWNDQKVPFPLVGDPPALSGFQKLNHVPASRAALLTGSDGAPWAAFCEFWSGRLGEGGGLGGSIARNCKRMHLTRMGESPWVGPGCGRTCVAALSTDEIIDADGFALHGRELYQMRDDAQALTRTVTLHRPGDPAPADASFTMPAGRALLYTNDDGAADVFVYWVLDPATTHYDVYRRDHRYQLALPLPAGIDPTRPEQAAGFDFLLSADGSALVVHQPSGRMTAYSTLDGSARELGTRPPAFVLDNLHDAVLTVGEDGFRSVPLSDGPDLVLAPTGFDPATLTLASGAAYYASGGSLWQVPLDGSAAAAAIAPGGARLLTLGPHGEIVYSRDPGTRYAGGAGDGWLGDGRLMERGRLLRFGQDGARVLFLEHAATIGTYGDLTSVALPDGAPVTLGLNVHAYRELPDHRVLAVENAVYAGSWNRLVVIDQAAGTKHWVVPSTVDFVLLPGAQDLIADVVSGASGYDILRVPVPVPP